MAIGEASAFFLSFGIKEVGRKSKEKCFSNWDKHRTSCFSSQRVTFMWKKNVLVIIEWKS